MKIKVIHIHNDQAIRVKGADSFEAWKTYERNTSIFRFNNALANGDIRVGAVSSPSQEQLEGEKGDY